MKRVLIVDDNPAVITALEVLLELHDIPVAGARSPEEACQMVEREVFGAVIQDMNFSEDATSGEEGVQLFRCLRQKDPFLPILLMTAWSSLESAVQLVKEGAYDYLSKPWDDAKLVSEIRTLLAQRELSGRDDLFSAMTKLCGMVCEDPKTQRVVETALQVAAADVPVLITGPNGSGKELLAQIIQANSARAGRPFVKVNAGALPDELFEAELFGAEAGAFTGAQKRRIGRFEEADGGTLFLDEIGNLGLAGQMKMLRVLQTGEFSRLGSNRILRADVRIISATNTDLPQAIRAGAFREDLFFRLNVVELRLPPLFERPGDILPLTRSFLKTLPGSANKSLSLEAERTLLSHNWPGNVRELRNRLQRACLVSIRPQLTPADLDLGQVAVQGNPAEPKDAEALAEIQEALLHAKGNVSKAAKRLGLSRQALYRRMEKYGIQWEKRPLN